MVATLALGALLLLPLVSTVSSGTAHEQTSADSTEQPAQQTPPSSAAEQPPQQPAAPRRSSWMLMQDGVIFGTYNQQGGLRSKTDFVSQNWWMGMATRPIGRTLLTLTTMVSLEPATTKPEGYAEIFQVGETYKNVPLVDYQHPHDFLMQLAAIVRVRLNPRTDLRFAAAPVGEATLGPPAFMHRRSAAENPIAPLSHHTFDSSHITMGVLSAGVDAGPLTIEGSAFHGREPDEDRWDLMDPGPLDSWSARVRLRPLRGMEIQGSYGFLKNPEALEPQDVWRSTASVTYVRERDGDGYTALMFAAGRNRRPFSLSDALLGEVTHRVGRFTLFGRYEGIELETEHLLFPGFVHSPHPGETIDPLHTLTIGGAVDVARVWGWEVGVGGDVQSYRVPERLQQTHGERPVSYHVFFRLRVPKSPMGRMWNTMMADGMKH